MLIFRCIPTVLLEMVSATLRRLNIKCRNSFYPRSNDSIRRFPVPDDKVFWSLKWDEYRPIDYTAPSIRKQPWADLDITDKHFVPKWNTLDGNINRQSFEGNYDIFESRPVNPIGRTGLKGRGVLGRWGPNHAADPIVSRWKRNEYSDIVIDERTKNPVLQFVAIKRRDSGEWAIPGGMVDAGEVVTSTLKREFLEEALNVLEKNSTEVSDLNSTVNNFFDKGEEVYKGYVDDPRNTDNAWMETVAMHFHDETGDCVGALPFSAGDDAVGVMWLDLDRNLNLYASHYDMINKIASKINCHW